MAEVKAKSISKTEIVRTLSETTGLSKKDINNVLEALTGIIGKNVGKKGPGVISLPGLVKIKVVHKKATPARKNVPNPFKPGELRDIPAKPARRQIKVQALKALKDLAK
jgi:nucleoid DNA-binding protein